VSTEPVTTDPRAAVLLRIARAHDRFVIIERKAWKAGDKAEAEGAHIVAIRLLRAYAAEDKDPDPKFVP
jgi:hypothetical protein